VPPLIKIKLVLNKILEVFGVYDSGSNVSLINSKLLKMDNKKFNNSKNTNLKTINGVKKANGLVKLTAKILNIEKDINVFVIDKQSFDYDFLVELDCIKNVCLTQDENLEIRQVIPTEKNNYSKKIISKEIKKLETENISKEITDSKTNEFSKENDLGKYEVNFNENINNEDFEIKINHLTHEQQSEIDKLILEYQSVFAKDKYDIGTVQGYEAHIDLLVDKYCSKRPYSCSMDDKKEIETQITKLLDKKLIEESYSPFAAPVTLAYKRDENKKSRLCIDFRDLNKIVVPQSQPFPLIEDLVVKTRDCKFFSTLDINSAL